MTEVKPRPAGRRPSGKFSWINSPNAILVVLALALATAGVFLFYTQRAQLLDELHRNLTGIADHKASRLSAWLAVLKSSAHLVGHDAFFSKGIARWLASGAATGPESAAIEAQFAEIIAAYGFDSMVLFDRHGIRKLAVGSKTTVGPRDVEKAVIAANSGRFTISDFHASSSGDGTIVLEFFAPVLGDENGVRTPVAAVIFRILSNTFITPLLGEQQAAHLSTESLLVRREGDEVVFLVDVLNSKASALNLRLPIHQPKLPAAMAARGIEGAVEGTDYGGRHVVAALRAVSGSDWRLVVKMDADEAYAPVRRLALTIAAMMLFVFAIAVWLVSLWWRAVSARRALREAQVALERQVLVKHFDYLSKYANDMIILYDDQFRMVEINDRVVETFQRPREELIGAPRSILQAPGREKDAEEQQSSLATSGSALFETLNCRKDGSTFPVEVNLRRVEIEGRRYYQGIARDITERKRAEGDLRRIEERYRALFERSYDCVFLADFEGRFLDANRAALDLLGYRREEIPSISYLTLLDAADLPRAIASLQDVIQTGTQRELSEYTLRRKDGRQVIVETKTVLVYDEGKPSAILGIARDITGRRQAEESTTQLAAIVEHSNDAIVSRGLDRTIRSWNPAAERLFGWKAEEVIGRGTACLIPPEREEESARNLALLTQGAGAATYDTVRLTKDGRRIDVSLTQSTIKGPNGEVAGISLVYRDMTERNKADETLRQSAIRLADNLRRTAQAIATTIEMRDPFTAGHQRRVSELAVAIGTALGLPAEQVEGIGFGASIHDVGLISIPAEILNRPGRLKPYEFSLVKTHSQAGYDVVKNLEFPWPVAQMILQHHERLDGSGYPAGLKGDAIILETRIISVADVVEAISSHRPYRPALGVEAALEEIIGNKGKLYDPAVVDACVKVFREQGFAFSEKKDAPLASGSAIPRAVEKVL